MAKHNKKRNVGLIHEQLVRFASEKIVEQNQKKAKVAMTILDKHFNNGSELYREFRLFNALVHTNVQDQDLARRIIQESKNACKNHDANRLRSEKSLLIKSINHNLDEKDFYGKKLVEYKVFATVQALLNEWRGADKLAPNEIIKYEALLEGWLTRPATSSSMEKNKAADPLALKFMIEKFNQKYSEKLNVDQARLLEFKLMQDEKGILNQIEKIKHTAITALKEFYKSCDNKVLQEKKDLVNKKIDLIELSTDDIAITRALILSKLIETIKE